MIDRIFYTIAAASAVAAVVLVSIVAYEWLKEQQAPVDNIHITSDDNLIEGNTFVGNNVYPLHRRTL